MKKLIALSGLLILYIYAFGASIWADKDRLKELITEDDRAKGAIVPVQELYNYLVEKAALKKTENVTITFEEQKAIPNMTKSTNNQFAIGLKDGAILPLEDWVNNKTYRLQLPSAFGDVMNIVFTPDNQMVIISLTLLPAGFVCGFSTRFSEEYDQAMGDKLFLPPIFQISLVSIVSSSVKDDQLMVWAGEQGEQHYYSHPTMKKYYYSLATLQTLYHLFTEPTIIPLLQEIQKARKENNPIALNPEQLTIFNSFSPDIKQALKSFISQS